MILQKILFLLLFLACAPQFLYASSLAEQFAERGYVEIADTNFDKKTFEDLYLSFDELIDFFQKNPAWIQKLYQAKERFIRSKNRNLYSTDFFGLYDESGKNGRGQISFYYSIHFHEFICSFYPEFNKIPQIAHFFNSCLKIQKPYGVVFTQAADQLDIPKQLSILLKTVKYLPFYIATKPHYDGTAFSLFLDSTDNQSLLISPYKSSFTLDDFFYPLRNIGRESNQKSILLIPGALLTEFSIYPTPHIVTSHGKTRYATIAFAMRPDYSMKQTELSALPKF